jgi:hypothetical protein
MIIHIENHGTEIVTSDYWTTEHARVGKLFASVNAGAVRLLLPPARRHMVGEVRGAKYAVLSRGPWPDAGLKDAVEIMWEDGSETPYAIHLSLESFDLLPAEPAPGRAGREWLVSTWESVDGQPVKRTEHQLHWRRVRKLPCLQELENVS